MSWCAPWSASRWGDHQSRQGREARITVSEGAAEVDMVMDVGGLLSGDLPGVYQDIARVVAASRPAPVKVILETCLLDDEQKAVGCLIALRAGAAYDENVHRLRRRWSDDERCRPHAGGGG